jgi:hypothetical protein
MFFKKDSVLIGLFVALALPVVFYALLLTGLEFIDDHAGFEQVQLSTALKPRTLALIAVCCNIFTMQYYRRLRADDSMRGVFIAVGLAAVFWILRYSSEIFDKF